MLTQVPLNDVITSSMILGVIIYIQILYSQSNIILRKNNINKQVKKQRKGGKNGNKNTAFPKQKDAGQVASRQVVTPKFPQ